MSIEIEEKTTCNYCGCEKEIDIFSSKMFCDIIDCGWKMEVIQIEHIIPEKIIRSQYLGDRIIKQHKKIEKKVNLKCDLCVLKEERNKKIKKIINKGG